MSRSLRKRQRARSHAARLTIFDEIEDRRRARGVSRACGTRSEPRAKRDLARRVHRTLSFVDRAAGRHTSSPRAPAPTSETTRRPRPRPALAAPASRKSFSARHDGRHRGKAQAIRSCRRERTRRAPLSGQRRHPFAAGPAEWPRVRDQLRATAYFVLGRVAATRGAYAEARRSLLMSLSLNHDEVDALYVLGVVQMALGDDAAAASLRPRDANRSTRSRRPRANRC